MSSSIFHPQGIAGREPESGDDMENLNDLFIFSQVVEHNGFTEAARALGVARSSICRRVDHLEKELGVRLVQRSTRHFAITEFGLELQAHCLRMVAEARSVYEKAACALHRPSGLVRISCPPAVAQTLIAPLLPAFFAGNPEVRVALDATNRRVHIDDNYDLSVRVREPPTEDSRMVMKPLCIVRQVLVASPEFLALHGRPKSHEEAIRLPTIGFGQAKDKEMQQWRLLSPSRQEIKIAHRPALISDDMMVILQAAIQGIGIAQLPQCTCVNAIAQGLLEELLPQFAAPHFELQVVFPTRRGMLPAVRSFIDFLSTQFANGEAASPALSRHGEAVKPPALAAVKPPPHTNVRAFRMVRKTDVRAV